jgi:hypothetical protein
LYLRSVAVQLMRPKMMKMTKRKAKRARTTMIMKQVIIIMKNPIDQDVVVLQMKTWKARKKKIIRRRRK